MTLIPESEIRDVHGITEEQKNLIKAYLQGAVYSWAKNRPYEQFAARDLVGGENYEWSGTPLIVLYEKHINTGKSYDEAIKAAAKDLGWLLKAVLSEDKRHFEAGTSGLTAGYRWIGNEPYTSNKSLQLTAYPPPLIADVTLILHLILNPNKNRAVSI